MTPKHALVRPPGTMFPWCLSEHPLKHTADVTIAQKQHKKYCKTLTELGLEVIEIGDPTEMFPDACFVEDTAVIHNDKALITLMEPVARHGEEKEVERILSEYMEIKHAVSPATIEGGDVIHINDRMIIGVTQRTNQEGAEQAGGWLGVKVDTLVDPNIKHLKSYATYLGNNTMIMTEEYADHGVMRGYDQILVPEEERFASNTLAVDETILMAKGYPRTQELVREAGFEVIEIDISEFEKCDGAITCLSLLF